MAFASANAVEQAVARLDALGLPRGALADPKLACVGPATGARLEALVRAPDLMPAEATGAALAASLAPHVRGKAVLVPRAADGRPELCDGLRAAGAEVVAPIAYRTVLTASPARWRRSARCWPRGGWTPSPSPRRRRCRGWWPGSGPMRRACPARCSAPSGRPPPRRCAQAGFAAGVVPAKHTAPALAEALAEKLGR